MSHCDCDDCKSRTPPAAPSDESVRASAVMAMAADLRAKRVPPGATHAAATMLESLLAANARLKADSVRLDWLDRDDIQMTFDMRGFQPYVWIYDLRGKCLGHGPNIRDAVDAALSPHNEAGK